MVNDASLYDQEINEYLMISNAKKAGKGEQSLTK